MKDQSAIEIETPSMLLSIGLNLGSGPGEFDYYPPDSRSFRSRNAAWVPVEAPLALPGQKFFDGSIVGFDGNPVVEWATDARQQQFLYLGTHSPCWRLFIDGDVFVPTSPPGGMKITDGGLAMRPVGIHRGDQRSHACRLTFGSPEPRMRRFALELIGVTFGGVQVPKGSRFGPTA